MKRFLDAGYRRRWLTIVCAATIIIFGAYVAAQQTTRRSANNLPTFMSKAIKHELDTGAAPADAVPPTQSSLRDDSTAFAIITNADQRVLASSAILDGQKMVPPSGTFSSAGKHGSDSFTWQPDSGVRLATRVNSYQNGSKFIVTGQSLAEPEKRIDSFGAVAVLAWIIMLAWVTIALGWHPEAKK